MGQGLDNVRRIYMEGIAGGDARTAVHKYTGHRYTQHSTGVGDGAEGFLAFFEPFVERNPKREIKIVPALEDGPLVFYAYQSLNDRAAEWVTMDMFYTDTDTDGLVLEHRDAIVPFVSKTQSAADMVGGTTEIDLGADSTACKALVLEYTKQVLQENEPTKLGLFVAEGLIQQALTIGSDRAGPNEWLTSCRAGSYEMLFQLFGQGDFVVTYGKRHARGKYIAVFDVYRVVEGQIVEYWMNEEEIGPRAAWEASGKF